MNPIQNIPPNYALVTGASTGLGAAFAHRLAKAGRALILVALPDEGLAELTSELIKTHGIKALFFEGNLTDNAFSMEIINKLSDEQIKVDLLINNAGIGGSQPFELATAGWLEQQIMLNVMHTSLFTHAILPFMKGDFPASILNVSSMAGLTPMPYKTVYPATKAFITHFSLGLDAELREKTNIRVFALHPGGMMTNADVSARLKNQNWIGRKSILAVDEIARIGLAGLSKNKPLIIPGWSNRLNYLLFRWVPWSIRSKALVRFMKRELGLA